VAALKLQVNNRETRLSVVGGALDHIGEWIGDAEPPSVVLLCTDDRVADLYADRAMAAIRTTGIPCALHIFPAGDASKCLAELARIHDALADLRAARDALLIALGGGVASDLTGFAAATWMRGVPYATCPTTLESAVDACVGGKTGINHAAGKNLIGAFHHPRWVAIDPDCLKTLPPRDLAAGLAESIKHALIMDADLLTWHEEQRAAIQAVEPDVMGQLIERNLRIKIGVVESDEREQGRRAILNFGHTIGHAIERNANYALRHGEAVALGMVAAAELSMRAGLLTADAVQRIRDVLAAFDLPVVAPHPLDVDAVQALTHGDKKVRGGRRQWVLLDGIGRAVIRDDVADEEVRAVIAGLNPV
jgi:3-dehydroquinate synthase